MSFYIRFAHTVDAPDIAALEKTCFSRPWNENGVLSEIENPGGWFIICRSEESLCGYISARFICGECYLGNLAVSPLHRRKGVGDLLLSALIETAKKNNALFISLEVRKTNHAAISLYEKHGFRFVGFRRNFYSAPVEDAAIYTLFLNESEKVL